MKRLLLAVLAGGALAYGTYRYLGSISDTRAQEVKQGQQLLQNTKETLDREAAAAQKRADEAAKPMPGER